MADNRPDPKAVMHNLLMGMARFGVNVLTTAASAGGEAALKEVDGVLSEAKKRVAAGIAGFRAIREDPGAPPPNEDERGGGVQ